MLESIPVTIYSGPTLRLALNPSREKQLRDFNLTAVQVAEVLALLIDLPDEANEVIEAPFANKRFLPGQTRFSDGSPVFYSALELETVEKEVAHWYRLGSAFPLPMYRRVANVEFSGDVKDLRPMTSVWPFLIADKPYDECNKLGTEAIAAKLAGLLSQSARQPTGTTLPVFNRNALSGTELRDWRVFTYNPATDEVLVTPIFAVPKI